MKVRFIMSRKNAFLLAWKMFWFATGTKRVGLLFDTDNNFIELAGDKMLKEKA